MSYPPRRPRTSAVTEKEDSGCSCLLVLAGLGTFVLVAAGAYWLARLLA